MASVIDVAVGTIVSIYVWERINSNERPGARERGWLNLEDFLAGVPLNLYSVAVHTTSSSLFRKYQASCAARIGHHQYSDWKGPVHTDIRERERERERESALHKTPLIIIWEGKQAAHHTSTKRFRVLIQNRNTNSIISYNL